MECAVVFVHKVVAVIIVVAVGDFFTPVMAVVVIDSVMPSFYVSFGVHYDTNADKGVADISVFLVS